jgi:hypothetical protein
MSWKVITSPPDPLSDPIHREDDNFNWSERGKDNERGAAPPLATHSPFKYKRNKGQGKVEKRGMLGAEKKMRGGENG